MLAVTGTKKQGGLMDPALSREEILNSRHKPHCSAYFDVSYYIIIVAKANVSNVWFLY